MRTCVLLVCGLQACVGGLPEENEVGNGVVLTIESRVAVSSVEIRVRDRQYNMDEVSKVFGGRDLREEPLVVLMVRQAFSFSGWGDGEHEGEMGAGLEDEFLVHVRGYAGGTLVAAAAALVDFGEDHRVTLVLAAEFNDGDGDGFEFCNDSDDCDCNDQNPTINPFTAESCDDFIDNNCSGLPINEGCPCNRDEFCTPLPEEFLDLAGIGMCYFGTLECREGELEITCDGGTHSPEVAHNLLDDDCDGVVDEGSDCTPGSSRRCFLGWVEPFPGEPGAVYPPEIKYAFFIDTAGVTCQAGTQQCDATGKWEAACLGEVRPQRAMEPGIGWLELPSVPSEGICAQCDGLDNDCNGQFDEEPWFDGDSDGYTGCGTIIDTAGIPTDPSDKITGMHADFVDCDDSRADVNPGMTEICGNSVDEDCRCDHGTAEIGQPYLDPPNPVTCTRPPSTCPSTAAYLDCGRLPRSDTNPQGVCSDGPGDCAGCVPYYHGHFGANQDCYLCVEQFGYGCSDTGACTTQAEDCVACDASAPTGPTDPSLVRPLCAIAGEGCEGALAPQWTPVFDADPNDECEGVVCTGHYWDGGIGCTGTPCVGGSGILNGQCFEMADQDANDVNCDGQETCQTGAYLCPLETERKVAPEQPSTICQEAISGCIGTTPPNYSDQANNNDLLNECNQSFVCDTFFFGIEADGTGADQCFFRADVPNSACNGAGACQDRVEACTTAARGAVVPGRPTCEAPTGGCTGESAPTYSAITDGSDPYYDCPLSSDGSTDLTCSPNGGCYSDLGDVCGDASDCQPGWTCPSGVCVD